MESEEQEVKEERKGMSSGKRRGRACEGSEHRRARQQTEGWTASLLRAPERALLFLRAHLFVRERARVRAHEPARAAHEHARANLSLSLPLSLFSRSLALSLPLSLHRSRPKDARAAHDHALACLIVWRECADETRMRPLRGRDRVARVS